MTTLTINQMSDINCGVDWNKVATIGCGIWAAGRFLEVLAFTNPIAACAAMGVDFACTVTGLGAAIVA